MDSSLLDRYLGLISLRVMKETDWEKEITGLLGPSLFSSTSGTALLKSGRFSWECVCLVMGQMLS